MKNRLGKMKLGNIWYVKTNILYTDRETDGQKDGHRRTDFHTCISLKTFILKG